MLILGEGDKSQPRGNSRFLTTRNNRTTLSPVEGQRLRAHSVGARPPAFSAAAVFFLFRAPSTGEAQPRRNWALVGSFESLRATSLVNPGPFSAASLKLFALGFFKAGSWKLGSDAVSIAAAIPFATE